MLNVIPGLGVRPVDMLISPRLVQTEPCGDDDSCVPGIPNLLDYNYKSATLMLMSLREEDCSRAVLGAMYKSRSPIRAARVPRGRNSLDSWLGPNEDQSCF